MTLWNKLANMTALKSFNQSDNLQTLARTILFDLVFDIDQSG